MTGGIMPFGEVRSLATALGGLSKDTSNLGGFRKGQIVSIEAGTPDTCTITLSGDSTSISGVFFLDSYIPTVDDVVLLGKQSGSLFILGSVNPTTTVVAEIPEIPEEYVDPNQYIVKSADTNRTNNTISDDPHLTLPVEANSTYTVHGLLVTANANGTGDITVGFTAPSGAGGWWHSIMPSTAMTSDPSDVRTVATDWSNTRTYGHAQTDDPFGLPLHGLLTLGATAGSLTVRWGQNATNATATIMHQNSYFSLTKIA